MLIMWRKDGQRIVIGGGIEITVRIEGNTVKFGVEAPKSVNIVRHELLKRSEKNNGNKERRINNAS